MSRPADRKPLHVLLPSVGSAGDVHPFIALALALQARGHRATILTSPYFQDLIERQGLDFLPVGSIGDFEAGIADPNLWHPRKGFEVVARRAIIPAIAEIYRLIEAHATADTVVAASGIAFGARIAQERLGVPTATVHLQPIIIRSLIDQGLAGSLRISASQPIWFRRALFHLLDWAVLDRTLRAPLNEYRATLGLPPVSRVLQGWVHSPQCVIAFFPEWFAARQSDWPPHTHLVGFPLWDGLAEAPMSPALARFLDDGAAPVIFTPGSAASGMQRFFSQSVDAVRRLGSRALLVTNFPQQVPRMLPAGTRAFGYVPFSQLLPRGALLVHHGGVGTLAQGIKAGIPQLIVPSAHDQFDNGWRIAQLRLGRSLARTRYSAARAANEIRAILGDVLIKRRCQEYAAKIDSASALARACDLLEALADDQGHDPLESKYR